MQLSEKDFDFEEWFAVQVRCRYEKFVANLLTQKGFKAFAPTYSKTLHQQGAKRQQEQALFPGYVFAQFQVLRRLPILMTPGVYSVVGYGKTPIPIPEPEILALENVDKARVEAEPCSFLSAGMKVRVIKGPLANCEGILVENRSSCRVVLSVTLIQRSVRVQVDRSSVVVLNQPPLMPTGSELQIA